MRQFSTLLCLSLAFSVLAANDDGPLMSVEDGKVYRKINGEPITGKDVVDLLLEEQWDQVVQLFVEYTLRSEEIQSKNIAVADAEVEAELQHFLDTYAKRVGLNPNDVKIDNIAQQFGGLVTLRRDTKANLALLRAFQRDNKIPAGAHTTDALFKEALRQLLERRIQEKGVVRNPKQLSPGEGVRIGSRSFARDEIRDFMAPGLRQMPRKDFETKIGILSQEELVQRALADKKLELKQEDLEFHYRYRARKREAETGVPGDVIMRQDIGGSGMSPQQFMQSRLFRCDAGISRLAKIGIYEKELKAEFAAHPERYKRTENMVAHLFVRVLDPDGRPYVPNWRVPGHAPVNDFAAKRREEQFTAAKPKIEGLLPLAKQDFADAAKKYSDDSTTAAVGGLIGRFGAETIPAPPCDKAVRDAAVKLKPGEVAGPVRSDYGWHIVKCLEKQEVTFDEAIERVYLHLIYESRLRVDEALRKDAKIEDNF